MQITLILLLITGVSGAVWLPGHNIRRKSLLRLLQRGVSAGAGKRHQCRPQTAAFADLWHFNRQAAGIGEHLHPGRRARGAAAQTQGGDLGKALQNAVQMRQVRKHHTFIDGLHQMGARMTRLQAKEAAVQIGACVGAI